MKTLKIESERLSILAMKRRNRKKKKFKVVFSRKFIRSSFMRDQSQNLEETLCVPLDRSKKVLNFTEQWQRVKQILEFLTDFLKIQ